VAAGGEPAAAATSDGVDLVEEDDAGRVLLRLLEEVYSVSSVYRFSF